MALASPKSRTLTVPSGVDLDIGGLQVPVHDAAIVGRFQCLSNLAARRDDFVEPWWTDGQTLGERRSLNQFEHQRDDVSAVLETVDSADVRVTHRGQPPRLRFESPSITPCASRFTVSGKATTGFSPNEPASCAPSIESTAALPSRCQLIGVGAICGRCHRPARRSAKALRGSRTLSDCFNSCARAARIVASGSCFGHRLHSKSGRARRRDGALTARCQWRLDRGHPGGPE